MRKGKRKKEENLTKKAQKIKNTKNEKNKQTAQRMGGFGSQVRCSSDCWTVHAFTDSVHSLFQLVSFSLRFICFFLLWFRFTTGSCV